MVKDMQYFFVCCHYITRQFCQKKLKLIILSDNPFRAEETPLDEIVVDKMARR
jgi:hypothetical protein